MPTWPLERKSNEAILLAVISIAVVGPLRYPIESHFLFIAEMALVGVLFIVALAKRSSRIGLLAGVATCFVPLVFAVVARAAGSPIAYEMTALSTLGAASLAMAGAGDRVRAMSLVASGFLTLFAVAISDYSAAVWFAIAWLTVCVWHLVANHWERLDLCGVDQVRRGSGVRPVSVLAAVAIFIVSGVVVKDRLGESKRFAFGFMPTSGGNQWSDPAARSGVGTGDAAIAAKDHAESFGAVESDLFLESTESTLFDMFNDSIGEPKKKKNKYERRQGLTAEVVLEMHTKAAKSEKGGSSFSADRLPARKHLHLDDAPENAVVQWAGPSGVRLAMNRYDSFDGVNWTNTAKHRNEKLVRREIDGAAWFSDSATRSLTNSTTDVNLLKVLRLDATRLPVPMLTTALHIKDVDRADFFGIEDDGSFFMPGRDKIPPLTVVNVASTKVMEDELWSGLTANSDAPATSSSLLDETQIEPLANAVAQMNIDAEATSYQQLQTIVAHLRSNFVFDRAAAAAEGEDAIATFLETRHGGDHLFATVAALMAREIGLQSRLVTGFYVRTSAIDIAAGHTNVLPDDVHVWAEIRLDDGRWFEIEPTPGYRQPVYTPSTWLLATKFAAAYWLHAIGLVAMAVLLYLTRLFWIELGLSVLYPIGSLIWPRGRMGLAMRVLQTRAKWAGYPRAAGRPQRDWLLSMTSTNDQLQESARRFCDAADRSAFADQSGASYDSTPSKELLMKLKIKTIRQANVEALV